MSHYERKVIYVSDKDELRETMQSPIYKSFKLVQVICWQGSEYFLVFEKEVG